MPTGTVGVTLPKAAPAGAGWISLAGTAAQVLPKLVAAGAGSTSLSGSVALTLPKAVLSGVGWSLITGTAATTLPVVAPALAAGSGPAGSIAATLKVPAPAESGWISLAGTAASTLKVPASAGIAKSGPAGTVAEVLKKVAPTLTGYFNIDSGVIVGEPELGLAVNVRSTSPCTVDHSNRERLLVFNSSSAMAVTLPQATGAFGDGFRFRAFNIGLGLVTITPTTSTVNGLAAITLPQWDSAEFNSDGLNWYAVKFSPAQRSITINIDGGAATPATGVKAHWSAPVACTVNGWVLTADASGSAVIDVKRATYSGFPTTASIAGSDKPTLSTQQKNQNLGPLSGWGSTAIAAGDVLEFNLDSVTTCKVLSLVLNVTVP